MVINAWVLLLTAIALEVNSTSLLSASQGMTRWVYSVCFCLHALAMTRIPIGIAYAVWSAMEIVAIAAIGWIVFRQNLSWAQLGFMALILVGFIGLNLTTVRMEG